MGKRGEITVFLSLSLLCVSALVCVMLESARTAGAKWYLQTAANSSLDSLFSEYHRQLWQTYHLLGLEHVSQEEAAGRFEEYLDGYLEADNWYPMIAEETVAVNIKTLTDDGGEWLEKEILDYMKYGIWSQLDIRPEDGETLRTNIKESAGMQQVTAVYEEQSDEAWKLEKALDKIYKCLAQQREYHSQAKEALSSEQSFRFQSYAGKLKQEINKLPRLTAAYEKQADLLKEKMIRQKELYQNSRDDLREDMNAIMGKELISYQDYVEDDGARRREIMELPSIGEQNLQLIEEVKDRVEEIEDYLSSLDEDDEDNSTPMWRSAAGRWGGIRLSGLTSSGKKDEEKRGWLSQLKSMAEKGLLGLVMPEGMEISPAVFSPEGLPSEGKKGGGETDKKNLPNRVLVNEYCAMHFSTALENKGQIKKETAESPYARYEMEYLLGGAKSDLGNLKETVKKIVMVRSGLNLMYLFSDSQKRGEARALAILITGALGMTPLVEITALFILSVWALGESVADVRALLSGKKVPLLKKREDWYLELEQLLEMGKGSFSPEPKGEETGFSYEGYLKLLLLAEESEQKYYRMMDVMQMHLGREQSGFRMESCAYRVDMRITVLGKHVFFSLPFVEKMTGSSEHTYRLEAQTEKAY